MPELPEAETIVRGLRPHLEGRTIAEARFFTARVSRDSVDALQGRRIEAVRRFGKQVAIALDGGNVVYIKLGMTGALLVNREPGPYTRAQLIFEDGWLCFDDIRQFGSMRLADEAPAKLGPDPFEIDADDFARRIRTRKTQIKRLLLDQSFVRGLGNIYTDEALFRARIHPKSRTGRMSIERGRELHLAIVEILQESIRHGGSSVSDYVGATGEKGSFQLLHQVYRKAGQPCPRCGAPIRRIVLAQRGTHYCATCQQR